MQEAGVADLAACAAEPIHVPGAIQPHGVLLAVRPDGGIALASANAADLLPGPRPVQPGCALQEFLDAAGLQGLLHGALGGLPQEGWVRRRDGLPLLAAVHAVEGLAVVELEAADPAASHAQALDAALRAFAGAQDLAALTQACCVHLRRLCGLDRVLVYRFDEDEHGEVIAEDHAAGLDPFLGHHYPESDIPRQARALYLRNWIRCIPDARYRPVPLVPARRPDTGAPLDLSDAHLRSVSPVHLEYLANMGVQASMSVSIVVEGRLWGLVSCGHRTPRPLPPALRRACETIGRVLSLQVGALEAMAFQRREAAAREVLAALEAALRREPARDLAGLLDAPRELLHLVDAAGAAVLDGEAVQRTGACPAEEDVRAIAAHVQPRLVDGFFCTRQLPRDDARFAALAARASGMMAVALPPGRRMLLWFRPEVPHTIVWGGDPSKRASVGFDDGVPRLHPRRSFARWQEEVRGRSLPWLPVERHLAGELRRRAVEVDLAYQVASHQAAVRARDELVAVVSHDLRTPVSVVAMQALLIRRLAGTDPGEGSKRLAASAQVIARSADRMAAMLRDLLDLARIEAGRFEVQPRPQDAAVLIADACELMRHVVELRRQHLVAEPPAQLRVMADAERIFHVFANLVGNASKFTPEGGTITVGARPAGGRCEFFVRDTGRGIPPDQLQKVFSRYEQGRPADQAEGLGLGLYICQGIVTAHGGRIWAESEPGRGSTFRFGLALAPEGT